MKITKKEIQKVTIASRFDPKEIGAFKVVVDSADVNFCVTESIVLLTKVKDQTCVNRLETFYQVIKLMIIAIILFVRLRNGTTETQKKTS